MGEFDAMTKCRCHRTSKTTFAEVTRFRLPTYFSIRNREAAWRTVHFISSFPRFGICIMQTTSVLATAFTPSQNVTPTEMWGRPKCIPNGEAIVYEKKVPQKLNYSRRRFYYSSACHLIFFFYTVFTCPFLRTLWVRKPDKELSNLRFPYSFLP